MDAQIKDKNRSSLGPYAWPGGYPICYLATDGWRNEDGSLSVYTRDEATCCAACASDLEKWPDLIVLGSYIHYEGPPEVCEWCNGQTESAYGDPEDGQE